MSYEVQCLARPWTLTPLPGTGQVGMILLDTDLTSEADYQHFLLPHGLRFYVNRIAYSNPMTPERLAAMQPDLVRCARQLVPGLELNAVLYGCTSATLVMGVDNVVQALRSAHPQAALITPPTAAALGLQALGVQRIAILAPYSQETSAYIGDFFVAQGYTVERLAYLDLDDDRDVARLPLADVLTAARATLTPQTEALFISCTALPVAQSIPTLEAALGVPVLSSNLACAWEVLRRCGQSGGPGAGRLLQLPLPNP